MPVLHESVVFDVHDCKVYKLLTDVVGGSPTYGPAVDVPGIAEVSLEPNFVTAELKGDARVIAKKGRIDRMSFSATYGKVSLDVLSVILGTTVVDSGTGTTETAKTTLKGANSLATFKLEFAINDVELGLGNITVALFKCQLTGGTLLGGSTDEFGQPTMDLDAIPLDSNDDMVDISFNETLAALSA